MPAAHRMEAIGRLVGGVAHDFNNLLTVINGCSDFLLRKRPDNDPATEIIQEINKSGWRAASLTRQLLAFSRKQSITLRMLDLNAVVIELAKMLQRLVGEDIDLVTSLDPSLGHVKADPGQLEQVIMNLVVNARDAMPAGGTLTILTRNVELEETPSPPRGFRSHGGPQEREFTVFGQLRSTSGHLCPVGD